MHSSVCAGETRVALIENGKASAEDRAKYKAAELRLDELTETIEIEERHTANERAQADSSPGRATW